MNLLILPRFMSAEHFKKNFVLHVSKGVPESVMETTSARGSSTFAFLVADNYFFTAESYGNMHTADWQLENFKIGTLSDITTKINVIDDVSSWKPGK